MRWSTVWWLATLAAVVMLEGNWTKAAPSPRSEDMFRELLKLDQMYSSIARPSVRSSPTQPDGIGPHKVQRAINMLRLQHLDRLYGDRSRPRFGKRTEINSNFSPIDYDGQKPAPPPFHMRNYFTPTPDKPNTLPRLLPRGTLEAQEKENQAIPSEDMADWPPVRR